MSLNIYIVFGLCVGTFPFISGRQRSFDFRTRNSLSGNEQTKQVDEDLNNLLIKVDPDDEKVSIKLYYECLCPFCRKFDANHFKPVVLKLNRYLDIKTYPYGNAKTIKRNDTYEFTCQHGPRECYGNKLHACALDLIKNKTEALLFNSCLMKPRANSHSSDDIAVDVCSKIFNVSAESIKGCAIGSKGVQLLKYYGDESKSAHIYYVPNIRINGKFYHGKEFMKDVCRAFVKKPPPCQEINSKDG